MLRMPIDDAWELNQIVDRVPYIPTDTDADFLPAEKVRE